MPILIEHPNHGRMHVYSADELAQHVVWGWAPVPEAPAKSAPVPAPVPAVVSGARPAPSRPPTSPVVVEPPALVRRGRPPKRDAEDLT